MPDQRCDLLCLDLPLAEALRGSRPDPRVARQSARRAAALGDATRLTIAAALEEGGELCVCDLAWVVERSENLVGHHLRTLREAGLASSRREHRVVFYALTDAGRQLVRSVLDESVGAQA